MRLASASTPPRSPTWRPMRDDDRRSIAAAALRSIDVELEVRRAELAALERARDLLERAALDYPEQCDEWRPDSPCAGPIAYRWCRACGQTFRRCDQHGGLRAASHSASLHRQEHGEGWGRAESATDERRLRERAEALSVGVVPPPPAPRGDAGAGQQAPTHEPASGRAVSAAGPGVLRRRGAG